MSPLRKPSQRRIKTVVRPAAERSAFLLSYHERPPSGSATGAEGILNECEPESELCERPSQTIEIHVDHTDPGGRDSAASCCDRSGPGAVAFKWKLQRRGTGRRIWKPPGQWEHVWTARAAVIAVVRGVSDEDVEQVETAC